MRTSALLFLLLSLSCRPKPEVSSAPDRSEEVTADKAAPPAGAQELGPVDVTDGGGCGALGVTGTYEGALRALRNKAATMGANYVTLGQAIGPHEALGCWDKGYTLRGVAYRVTATPAATSATTPSSTATAATPTPSSVTCRVKIGASTVIASFGFDTMAGTVAIEGGETRRFNVVATPYAATYSLVFASYGDGDKKPATEALVPKKSVVARLVTIGDHDELYFDSDVHLVASAAAGVRCER